MATLDTVDSVLIILAAFFSVVTALLQAWSKHESVKIKQRVNEIHANTTPHGTPIPLPPPDSKASV